MPDRLVELESKVAMLEHTVDALSGELAAHRCTLDQVREQVAALLLHWKKNRGGDGSEPIEPHDTPPPHWGGAT